ncbi:hypothetical protein ACFQL4_26125 [Halosimplex aquaticum]
MEGLVQYFLASFLLAFVALIPLGWLVGVYALVSIVVFPILGTLLGLVVWKRACSVVDDSYRDVLAAVIELNTKSADGSQVWVSGTRCAGEQYGIEPAREYTFTRVIRTDDYISIDEIMISLARMETVVQSEQIPMDRITTLSFEQGVLTVNSTRGVWNLCDLERVDS